MGRRIQYDALVEAASQSDSLRDTADTLGLSPEKLLNDMRSLGVNPGDFSLVMWGARVKTQSPPVKPDTASAVATALVPSPDVTGTDEEILRDPLKILEVLKEAILRRQVDLPLLSKAVKQVLENYEFQNRMFMVAAANAELPRVLKLLSFIDSCENEVFKPARVERASTKELSRLYALAQSNLMSGLDRIKRVADMRLEMVRATGSGSGDMSDLFKPTQDIDELTGMPSLDSQGRDKVRKIIDGVLKTLDEDTSVETDDG